jgi:hypothetical protein
VTKFHLAVLLALGICSSTGFAFVVGIAWAVWRGSNRPPAVVRIRYVERVPPTPSAVPTTSKEELSAH